jgi:hypothetical protein
VQDAEIVAITVPTGAQHSVPGKADPRHPPSPQAQPRLKIGRRRDDGGEAYPDVTVETPDLLAQGEMDYQILVVDDELGHWVEDTRAGHTGSMSRVPRGGGPLSPHHLLEAGALGSPATGQLS